MLRAGDGGGAAAPAGAQVAAASAVDGAPGARVRRRGRAEQRATRCWRCCCWRCCCGRDATSGRALQALWERVFGKPPAARCDAAARRKKDDDAAAAAADDAGAIILHVRDEEQWERLLDNNDLRNNNNNSGGGDDDGDAAAGGEGAPVVVVKFTATWCRPCARIAPLFRELAQAHAAAAPRLRFAEVDLDEAGVRRANARPTSRQQSSPSTSACGRDACAGVDRPRSLVLRVRARGERGRAVRGCKRRRWRSAAAWRRCPPSSSTRAAAAAARRAR
eukprot:scaffold2706_cov415-Prasinococcus_capsulatus_cf.AAC.3